MNPVTGQFPINAVQHISQCCGLENPDIMNIITVRYLKKTVKVFPFHRDIMPVKINLLKQDMTKWNFPFRTRLQNFRQRTGKRFLQRQQIFIRHKALAYSDLNLRIHLQSPGKDFNFRREPDIILIAKEKNVASCAFRKIGKIIHNAKTSRIGNIGKSSMIAGSNCFNRSICPTVPGIISNQNLIRNTGLTEQAFKLLGNILFPVICSENYRYF